MDNHSLVETLTIRQQFAFAVGDTQKEFRVRKSGSFAGLFEFSRYYIVRVIGYFLTYHGRGELGKRLDVILILTLCKLQRFISDEIIKIYRDILNIHLCKLLLSVGVLGIVCVADIIF